MSLPGTSSILSTTKKSYFQVEILRTKTTTTSLYKKCFADLDFGFNIKKTPNIRT